MALWRFFDYITVSDENLLQSWYDGQDQAVQAQFDVTLIILGGISDWEDETVEEFKPLIKRHVGLGEIRFHIDERPPGAKRAKRRRFRPVGAWPPLRDREFVLILGCEETRMAYIPNGAFDLALRHKADLVNGKGQTREHS